MLRPGGRAVVHHPGSTGNAERAERHRSNLTDAMFCQFAAECGLVVQLQTTEFISFGEVLTVLVKPTDPVERRG